MNELIKNKVYNELPEIYLKRTLNFEGGLTKNPKDSGNWYGGKLYGTNRGITMGALAKAQSEGLVGRDVTIESLTTDLESVRKIYEVNYYRRSKANLLPHTLAFAHFDACVNSGIGSGARFLQSTINKLLPYNHKKLTVDGGIGPLTLNALAIVLANNEITEIAKIYNNYRENLIVTSKKINPIFKKGLINRINSVRKYTDQ